MSQTPAILALAGRAARLPPTRRAPISGNAIIIASAAAFSTAGLFTRLLPTDAWTMLFWRGLFGGLLIAAVIAWQEGRQVSRAFRAIGRAGLLAAACSTLGTICFILALRDTSVAEVTIIFATAPFLAAAMAWAWGAERPRLVTLIAIALALLGVVVMVGAGRGGGGTLGRLLAFGMTALMALMMVVIRRNRQVSMLPAACLSAFACAALVLPLANPAAVTSGELALLFAFGTTQFGLGLLLLTIGSRRIPATRASLLGNLELPFAPLWVWLAFGEAPSIAATIGGAIVAAAIALDLAGNRTRGDTT